MGSPGVLIVERACTESFRNPGPVITGLASSLFFLAVFGAGIGGVEVLPGFENGGYLAFLLPMSIVALSLGNPGSAAPSLARDVQSGYISRLYLAPVPRRAFVIAPIVADLLGQLLATSVLLVVGILFGLPFRFGVWSILAILALAALWNLGFTALSATIVLRTGRAEGTQILGMLVFPLLFLSTTFLPASLIRARWLLQVAKVNPVTWLLEGMRTLIAGSENPTYLLWATAFLLCFAGGSLTLALLSNRKVGS
ncbi:MAG: ABC transporter permease [Alkalispirochaetaceae bacterium]